MSASDQSNIANPARGKTTAPRMAIRRRQRRQRFFRSIKSLIALVILFAGFAAAASVLTKKPEQQEARKGSAVLPAAVLRVEPKQGYTVQRAYAGRIIARRAADIGLANLCLGLGFA